VSLPPDAARYLTDWLGEGWTATPLAGDASIRAYYRIEVGDQSYIVAYYPEEVRHQLRRSLAAYGAIASHARVPEVLEHCEVAVLQRDVGDVTLFDVLHRDRAEGVRLYREAIDLLVAFQEAPDAALNPPFTAEFFLGEMAMAGEYYVEKLMESSSDGLQPLLKRLCENVAHHPYVLCHRDYHGQNIHVIDDTLYLIDYQDLRLGPDTYDLASLLRDRGVARILGDETELELLDHYRRRIDGDDGIRRRYFETLLQRSIKILGTFSKQPIVRGRMHYLDFIPPTLDSIRRCLDELPEYAALRDIFPLAYDAEAAAKRARELNEEVTHG